MILFNPDFAITFLQMYVANKGVNYTPRRLLAANSLPLDKSGCDFFKLCVNVVSNEHTGNSISVVNRKLLNGR